MTNPTFTTFPLQIAVLDRGFVYVGRVENADGGIVITEARCIRRWGTSAGLGELALKGPQQHTKLDFTGTVCAPYSAVMHLIDCDQDAWAQTLTASA